MGKIRKFYRRIEALEDLVVSLRIGQHASIAEWLENATEEQRALADKCIVRHAERLLWRATVEDRPCERP